MLLTEEDDLEALATPLLTTTTTTTTTPLTTPNCFAESEESGFNGAAAAAAAAAATTADSSCVIAATTTSTMAPLRHGGLPSRTSSMMMTVFFLFIRGLHFRSVADVLPPPFSFVVWNWKLTVAVFLGVNLALTAMILPFWLISYLTTEWGIYLLIILLIFLLGRALLVFAAFPGASEKVILDVENEFSKYSNRMLLTALGALKEAAGCFLQANSDSGNTNTARQMLEPTWSRAETYRDRVLAVFTNVLLSLFRQPLHERARTFPPPKNGLDPYGNNLLVPDNDIGNLSSLSPKGREEGRELLAKLQQLLVACDALEMAIQSFQKSNKKSSDGTSISQKVMDQCSSLEQFCNRGQPQQQISAEDEEGGDDAAGAAQPGSDLSMYDAVKTGLSSIIPMLDPEPHSSIFCLDFLRGCVLSRYRGARQFWVDRASGRGQIDVLYFPAQGSTTDKRLAVLYCNPNAGLMEVSAGFNMMSGNVSPSSTAQDGWTDFYLDNIGTDVYLFNYAGYGRSIGTDYSCAQRAHDGSFTIMSRISRILHSALFAFKPRPETLRQDGVAVAKFILSRQGADQLILHGESIGGMTAAGVAKYFTKTNGGPRSAEGERISLLVCDRTFCNLEAVAQRLVGQWTAHAIRILTFFSWRWNTDVTGDFAASTCPKVLAQDADDVIIADSGSLKAGIALWKELHRTGGSTNGIGWTNSWPLHYRMADFENKSVVASRYSPLVGMQAPRWPRDKHVSVEEAMHFAACCKRIGKIATEKNRDISLLSSANGEDHTFSDAMAASWEVRVWAYLAACDGLVGSTLGSAVKSGMDACIAWLCATLVFGGQVLVERAGRRPQAGQQVCIEIADFDPRMHGTMDQGPTPIPEMVSRMERVLEERAGDPGLLQLKHELVYVAGMLRYIQQRLSATSIVEEAVRIRRMKSPPLSNHGCDSSTAVGSFLKLTCGHNAQFSADEKQKLETMIRNATSLDD